MLSLILIWVALFLILVTFAVDKRRKVGALTLAYFFSFSLLHVPGALAFIYPSFNWAGADATRIGFEVTLLGMATYIVGASLARIFARHVQDDATARHAAVGRNDLDRLGWRVITIGVICNFVVLPISAAIPSLTAIVSSLGALLILGFLIRFYAAAVEHNVRRTLLILATLPLLPIATLVTGGFLGYGTGWVLSILAFCHIVAKRRIWIYLFTPLIVYFGLSLFVTYIHQRNALRDEIWYRQTSVFQRLEKISGLITEFEYLDLTNPRHLFGLNERLNQNDSVGRGVTLHRNGLTELAYGATVPWWALIPRAVWPDKPQVGGGGDLVTKFTGQRFAEGTSVGAGQVLEFYMNFGMPGVLIGFAALGFAITRLDQAIMRALANGRITDFLPPAMVGLTMLNPGGNLLEIFVSVVSAIITARLLGRSKILDLPNIPGSKSVVSRPVVRAALRP